MHDYMRALHQRFFREPAYQDVREEIEHLRRELREQLDRLEKYTRRFRKHYAKMTVSASRYRPPMEDLRAAGALALEELQKKKEQLQAARRRNK